MTRDGRRIVGIMVFVAAWAGAAAAAPLDDQLAAFAQERPQTEATVQRVLETGLSEGRSARAYAAVAGWLDANSSGSQPLLFAAGRAAEFAGEWSAATSFYRQLLENPRVDPRVAGEAVPAVYRLLIDPLGQPEAAYQFMREHGDRLRAFGTARRFDDWFLTTAKAKDDVPAVCNRLATIIATDAAAAAARAADLEWACGRLESLTSPNDAWFAAAGRLAAVPRLPSPVKARIDWVMAAVPVSAEFFQAGKPVPDAVFDKLLPAAKALVAASPFEGSILVARGWMNFNHGDSPTFSRYLADRREAKAAPILEALSRLSPQQAHAVLTARGCPRGRPVSLLFSPAELRALTATAPAVFNTLAAAPVPLADKATLTVEEAKALAPHLARNPQPDAALIRAIAAAGSLEFSAIAAALPPELWRFADPRPAADAAWGASAEQAKKMEEVLPLIAKPDPRAEAIAKQIDKGAPSQARLAAFQTLAQDLLAPAPTIRNALALWDQLFANAPEADAVAMLQAMLDNLEGDREVLLRRAVNVTPLGGHLVYWQPWTDNFMHNGGQRDRYRAAAAPLIPKLQDILAAQARQGRLSELLFGIWLHAANPQDPAAQGFIQQLVTTPAYATLPPAYRASAAQSGGPDGPRFGLLAVQAAMQANEPAFVSQPLMSLPADAAPAAVEAALEAAVKRAASAPWPLPVVGLRPVAALPEWSPKVRGLVFSLMRENAPLGGYPAGAGYEQLTQRLCQEYAAAKQWQAIEPYAAGLWQAAAAADDRRSFRAAADLAGLAEASLAAGHPSAALSLARAGLGGAAGRALASNNEVFNKPILPRLQQIRGRASLAVGTAEIPVEATDPSYPVYKSAAEFASGNLDAAWSLYVAHVDQLQPLLRKLPTEYTLWLLRRTIAMERTAEAETIIKELTLWSRAAPGTLDPEQEARLKIAYADIQFLRGALATARAWYRKVADAAEFRGSEMQLLAGLGSARVDRVTKNFSAALTELDKLVALSNPAFTIPIRYARAEVLMDQENFKEALDEIAEVLRQEPKHPDALILQGKIHTEMRKLIEASEIELGPSQTDTVLVPGETVKINLRDPTLSISGVTAEIEVEVRTKSGDRELVLLAPLGDSRDKFRAEVPTALGAAAPGDKTLQIVGGDEIRFGYSPAFRAKMRDLPADPDTAIGVASDARLGVSAGGFPALAGERRLSVEELGLSTAQAKLGFRAVRPGNPVYVRVIDPDRSTTGSPDQVVISLTASSGDQIRSLPLVETAPYSGIFEGTVPTAASQAIAFASENAPGRDPGLAISPGDQPGWQGKPGNTESPRIFGVDLNDDVPLAAMTIRSPADAAPTHFVLQTSLNGRDWTSRSRWRGGPDPASADGRPQVTSFPTSGAGSLAISPPSAAGLPADWRDAMDLLSTRASVNFLAAPVAGLDGKPLPVARAGHPQQNPVLARFRGVFFQPTAAIRRFRLAGWPAADGRGAPQTFFLLDGQPAPPDAADRLVIERELTAGLHTIEVWRLAPLELFDKEGPTLLGDVEGQTDLAPCPEAMFDPATFPAGVREQIPLPATITRSDDGYQVAFAAGTRSRMVRLVILGFAGVAPGIEKVVLTDAAGTQRLPVAEDVMALRNNDRLEVLPGDTVSVRYVDPVSATPGRTRHEDRLTVAFNTATISASFLDYRETSEGRVLELEPIRRFAHGAAIGIVIDDADMDTSPEPDVVEFRIQTADGATRTMQAVETENHSGRFLGRVFPVAGEPARDSEIQVAPGGSLTATYRDAENLDPGVPADRSVTMSHARYARPAVAGYTVTSSPLPDRQETPPPAPSGKPAAVSRGAAAATFEPRRSLSYGYVADAADGSAPLDGLLGAALRLDVVIPHLALAQSSTITAYAQTEAARRAAGKAAADPFDIGVPGTIRLTGTLDRPAAATPPGYVLGAPPQPPTSRPPLEEGRFAIAVPLVLGDPPARSLADKAAESLPRSALPAGLAVKAGDVVHVGFAWEDDTKQIGWQTVSFTLAADAFLDLLTADASAAVAAAYVGEPVVVRLLAPGLDRGPDRDAAEVDLATESGWSARLQLSETQPHSGIFTGSFTTAYAEAGVDPGPVAAVGIEGLPVRYGDTITVTHDGQSRRISINKGADGLIEPFTKRYGGDEVAVRTAFTLAECFLELAKKHAETGEESLARREIDHAEKLLAEALATHRDDSLEAHAEYLLGNLAQEFADLARNEESRRPRYQQALKRFSEIPLDYPDTEFAPKAQYKTAQTYEKLGQAESAVEEYVKLAYKYPGDELIPAVMSRLGDYFQKQGQGLKDRAAPLREQADDAAKAEVIRLDELSALEFLKAARVFEKLLDRFPDDPLAPLAGVRAGQNYMRAHRYDAAVRAFEPLLDNEAFDGPTIRAQALYWSAYARELWPVPESNWKLRGDLMGQAYKLYQRITFDYPDSIWAKRARGRLADPAFAGIIERERAERQMMIDLLRQQNR